LSSFSPGSTPPDAFWTPPPPPPAAHGAARVMRGRSQSTLAHSNAVAGQANMRVVRHRRNESTGTTSGDESERDELSDFDEQQAAAPIDYDNFGPNAKRLAAILTGAHQ
jgi:hypothetical protein